MRVALVLAATCVSASAVTPIEKVVLLLKDLQGKVDKQGNKEAAQYDKYACFCKNQAGFKANAISKSADKIAVMAADISDLEAEISQLDSDTTAARGRAKKAQEDTDKKTAARETANTDYIAKEADLSDAISACNEAIEALKASKSSMKGADLDLMQLKTAAFNMKVSQTPEAMSEALSLVRTASAAAHDAKGEAEGAQPAYKYQGNDIIATIEGLQDTFKENKKTLDFAEMKAVDVFNREVVDFTNIKNFANKEAKEKSTLSMEKGSDKSDTETSKTEEETNKQSDEDFLAQLKLDCAQKAKDWDQRSKSRSEEIAALSEATALLEAGAVSQYGANKKLTGLVEVKAVSFLQRGASKGAAIQRLLSNLDSAAIRLKSPVLSAIALKVQLKGDHFSNVRALIKDLVAKLKADATAEATTKGFCDTEMRKAINRRDTGAQNVEEQNGIIATKTALAAKKATEMEDLSEDIAELNKKILEATELRISEKANNAETVEEAKAGSAAVKSALVTLKGFYGIQVEYKPPKSDRFGNTVGDAAPEAFSGDYNGQKESAGGIIGILEVIQSDFDRTVTTVGAAETKAAKDFTTYKTGANKDIKSKSGLKADALKAKEGAEQAIVAGEDDLYDAKKLREAALDELEKLSPMCVEGEETYAERVQKRKDEIEALKEAMKLLDDWQSF